MGCFEESVGLGDVGSDFDDEYVSAGAVPAFAASASGSTEIYSHADTGWAEIR